MSKHTAQISEFIKATLELGGALLIDDDWSIRDCEGELITIDVRGKPKSLVVFNDKMKHGDYCIINPMVEPVSSTLERAWYFSTLSSIIGEFVKALMVSAIQSILTEMEDDSDGDFIKMEAIQGVAKHVDKKLLGECKKLHTGSIIRIFYSGRDHVAQAQTELYSHDYFEELGTIRKKSWGVFQGLFESFVGTNSVDKKFVYKSSQVGFSKTDAMLNLYLMVLEELHPHVGLLLPDNSYDLGIVMGHMENIKEYHKDCQWFANGNVVPKLEETAEPTEAAPWQQTAPVAQPWQQPMQQPVPQPQPIPVPISRNVPVKSFFKQPQQQQMVYNQQPQQGGYAPYPQYGQQQQQQVQHNMAYQQPQQGMMMMPQPQQQMMYPGQPQQQMMAPPTAPIDTRQMIPDQGATGGTGASGISYKDTSIKYN